MDLTRSQHKHHGTRVGVVLQIDLVVASSIFQPDDLKIFVPVMFFEFHGGAGIIGKSAHFKVNNGTVKTVLLNMEKRYVLFCHKRAKVVIF
jgi:hypothetical protein